jgi:uncharacterized membrane protein
MAFARFISKSVGRIIRATIGIVGLVPLTAGLFNLCLVRGYFEGRKNLEVIPRDAPQH